MLRRNPFHLNRNLSIILQTSGAGGETPIALRINMQRLSNYLVISALVFAFTSMGTLLFFRELELNRRLQENVLRLETERRLYKSRPVAFTPAVTAPVTRPTETPSPAVQSAPPLAETNAETIAETVAGRINDLRVECTEEECAVRLGLVTSKPGTAVGQLLLVLETEVPRIGAASPSAPVRRRYFVYPGETAKDDLDPNTLNSLEHKAFKFSRALQTNTVFKVGKLLRPLALNAYVFDSEKALLQHERRAIETEEN